MPPHEGHSVDVVDRLPVDGRNRPVIYTFVSLYPQDTKEAFTDQVVDGLCTPLSPLLH